MNCVDIGSTNSDIAGLGIVISFFIQSALSVVLSIWTAMIEAIVVYRENVDLGLFDLSPGAERFWQKVWGESDAVRLAQQQRLCRILTTISDTQFINGISLLIAALNQHNDLSLYHYHVTYDTVNLVGVSAFAGLFGALGTDGPRKTRDTVLFVYLSLYLGFIILFGIRLQKWNDEAPGLCFNTRLVTSHALSQQFIHRVYLAITAFFFFGLFTLYWMTKFLTWAIKRQERAKAKASASNHLPRQPTSSLAVMSATRRSVTVFGKIIALLAALAQFPLHSYMIFAMRASNEPYLSGDSENTWGFGQVVALVLVGPAVLECIQGGIEYYHDTHQKPQDTKVQQSQDNGVQQLQPESKTDVEVELVQKRRTV